MFGFLFGTLCLLMLFAVAKSHRRAYAHHHHHHRRRFSGRRYGRAMGEMLKRRLHVDDEQEPIVDHAWRDLRRSAKKAREAVTEAREAVADAMRDEDLDDAAIDVALSHLDEQLGRSRAEIRSAVRQVHAVLDDDQRADLADLIARGPRPFGRW